MRISLGNAVRLSGRLDAAVDLLATATAADERSGEPRYTLMARQYLLLAGDPRAAETELRAAVALARRHGDRRMGLGLLTELDSCYLELGRVLEAQDSAATALRSDLDSRFVGKADCGYPLGRTALGAAAPALGDPEASTRHLAAADAVLTAIGSFLGAR